MKESATELSDDELLKRIRNRDAAPVIADRAFEAFYNRHRDYVYDQVCFIKRKLRMKQIDEEDFVIQVFRKVLQSGCRSYSRSKSNPEVAERLSVRAWLGTISKNLILDELRVRSSVFTPDESSERTTGCEPEDDATTQDSGELIQMVRGVLSERDAKVVWFKIQAYNPVTGESEPDAHALEVFCSEIGITPLYLRKIYSRAITTLREAMVPQIPFIHKE